MFSMCARVCAPVCLFSYLDLAVDEQLLHSLPVPLVQPSVVQADAEGQRQLQVGVPHRGHHRLDLRFGRWGLGWGW